MSISNQLKKLASSCLILSSPLATQVAAADDGMEFTFSGFASVQAAKTITADKYIDTIRPDLTVGQKQVGLVWGDIPTDWELSKFNKVGLRLDVDMKYNLDFAAQFVSYGRTNYEPIVDWLYVRYNFTPEINISLGKTRIPLYMYSDVLDVGYAYQWIAPPPSVYGVDPLRAIDGIQFNWTTEITGDWFSDLTMWAGQSQQDLPEVGDKASVTNKDSFGVGWSVSNEWLTLRAVYHTSRGTLDDPVFNKAINDMRAISQVLAPFGVNVDGTIDRLAVAGKRSHFFSAGFSFDLDQFFIIGEGTFVRNIDSPVYSDVNAYYITGGYRLPGNVTLSLTYSIDDDKPEERTLDDYGSEVLAPILQLIEDGQVPDAVKPLVQGSALGGAVITNSIDKSGYENQHSYTLGARWDFHTNAAAKFEYIYQDREKYNELGTEKFTVYPQAVRFSLDLVF